MKNNFYVKALIRLLKEEGIYDSNAQRAVITVIDNMKSRQNGYLPCNFVYEVFSYMGMESTELRKKYMQVIVGHHISDVKVYISRVKPSAMHILDDNTIKNHIIKYELNSLLWNYAKPRNGDIRNKLYNEIFFSFIVK